MKIKLKIIIIITTLFSIVSFGQDNKLENNWIVNFINPAIEYELVTGNNTILSSAIGIGYSGAYKDLTITEDGFNYIIAPFFDLQYKYFYNREKREQKNRIIHKNSGDFVSFRAISRAWSITDNVIRSDNFDFAIGPTWGIQRSYNKIRILFDIGPQYYFDSLGNDGFFPLMLQINFGLNLSN